MKVALLTPMKPPDHPVPSGDRTFARLIKRALQTAGHAVSLPSTLTTWRKTPEGLASLVESAAGERERIAGLWQREGPPDAILTYHNYHKAPDLLGPALADRFALPYAIVEASRASKRAHDEWADHFALADKALLRADALAAVTQIDYAGLAAFRPEMVVRLPPFIDTVPFEGQREGPPSQRLVTAVMMRQGRKADSMRVLAEAFAKVRHTLPDAKLTIAGDGDARADLEPLFNGADFVGRLDQADLAALFARADLFVWPAIDEPFGFVFLEAQAAGLPVVGGAARGVVDIVEDGVTGLLVPPRNAGAFADAVMALLTDLDRRLAMSKAGRAFMAKNDLAAGADRLTALLSRAAAHRNTVRAG